GRGRRVDEGTTHGAGCVLRQRGDELGGRLGPPLPIEMVVVGLGSLAFAGGTLALLGDTLLALDKLFPTSCGLNAMLRLGDSLRELLGLLSCRVGDVMSDLRVPLFFRQARDFLLVGSE